MENSGKKESSVIEFLSVLCIDDISPFVKWFVNMFSNSAAYIVILLIVWCANISEFDKVPFVWFCFCCLCFGRRFCAYPHEYHVQSLIFGIKGDKGGRPLVLLASMSDAETYSTKCYGSSTVWYGWTCLHVLLGESNTPTKMRGYEMNCVSIL